MPINDALQLAILCLGIVAIDFDEASAAAETLRQLLIDLEATAAAVSGFDFED
jgi:hypothetical protein